MLHWCCYLLLLSTIFCTRPSNCQLKRYSTFTKSSFCIGLEARSLFDSVNTSIVIVCCFGRKVRRAYSYSKYASAGRWLSYRISSGPSLRLSMLWTLSWSRFYEWKSLDEWFKVTLEVLIFFELLRLSLRAIWDCKFDWYCLSFMWCKCFFFRGLMRSSRSTLRLYSDGNSYWVLFSRGNTGELMKSDLETGIRSVESAVPCWSP